MPLDGPVEERLYEAYPYPPAGVGRAFRKRRAKLLAEGGRLAGLIVSRNPAASAGSILDAGCGTGIKSAGLAAALPGSFVLGVDASEASLAAARDAASARGARNAAFRRADIEDPDSVRGLGAFDAVVCDGVLHHLANPGASLASLAGVLNPGGVIYVSTFSRIGRQYEARVREILGRTGASGRGLAAGIKAARALMGLPSMVSARHSAWYDDDAFLADAFLNPVEHRFDVPALADMCGGCGLVFLTWPEGEKHAARMKEALESGGTGASGIGMAEILGFVEIWKAPSMISALAQKPPLPGAAG